MRRKEWPNYGEKHDKTCFADGHIRCECPPLAEWVEVRRLVDEAVVAERERCVRIAEVERLDPHRECCGEVSRSIVRKIRSGEGPR